MFDSNFWNDRVMARFQGIFNTFPLDTDALPVDQWWSDISSHPPLQRITMEELNAMNEAAAIQYINTSAKLEEFSRSKNNNRESRQESVNSAKDQYSHSALNASIDERILVSTGEENCCRLDIKATPSSTAVNELDNLNYVHQVLSTSVAVLAGTKQKSCKKKKSNNHVWGPLQPKKSDWLEIVQFLYSNPPLKSESVDLERCLHNAFNPNDSLEKQIGDFARVLSHL